MEWLLPSVSSQPILCAPQAEAELQEQYFQPLVKKEELEEKMRNIKAVKCRVVTCKTVSEGEPRAPAGEWNMDSTKWCWTILQTPSCHSAGCGPVQGLMFCSLSLLLRAACA